MQVTNAVSQLLLEIDEAWLDYAERSAASTAVSQVEVELEELLFRATEWLELAKHRIEADYGAPDSGGLAYAGRFRPDR